MPQSIVYILGAGFSAPLGLPVMRDFLVKSKDMYFSAPDKYEALKKVLETIDRLSTIKNYFRADLFNIEEVLSILEMRSTLESSRLSKSFTTFISQVIDHYTPEIPSPQRLPSNWQDFIFGDSGWGPYGLFVSSLFQLEYTKESATSSPAAAVPQTPGVIYHIVSLNYDLVLENTCGYINEHLSPNRHLAFLRTPESDGSGHTQSITLAKLHGSVDTSDIIPPTWSKRLPQRIAHAWRLAFDCIASANELRLIGYSLPIADAYVRYLLKSAVTQAPHLKQIDAVCLDPDGSVRERYDQFIDFNYYRFSPRRVEDYFGHLRQGTPHLSGKYPARHLEPLHTTFMEESNRAA